jgi:hypothetical protein
MGDPRQRLPARRSRANRRLRRVDELGRGLSDDERARMLAEVATLVEGGETPAELTSTSSSA